MSDVAYLDRAAATEPGRRYKGRLLELLGPRPGHTALDVGCGPGTDLQRLADAVGPTGHVIGVDRDPTMVTVAGARFTNASTVDVRLGDGHALALPANTVDRVWIDRVLQHVADPPGILAEVARLLRPDGVVALADNDWDTLVIDSDDLDTSRAYTRYVATQVVRNATIGRQLGRLAHRAGLTVQAVEAHPVVFTDYACADAILRFGSVTRRAVADGFLNGAVAERWLAGLVQTPTFFASLTFQTVIARRLP